MKTYARVSNGVVAELVSTDVDPATLFYPSLQWQLVTDSAVVPGWLVSATGFTPPVPPAPTIPPPPTLSQLQAELTALAAQIAALTPKTGA